MAANAYREIAMSFDQCLFLGDLLSEAENALYEIIFHLLDDKNSLDVDEKKQAINLARMYELCRSLRVAVTDQHGIDTESRTDFYTANRILGGLTFKSVDALRNKNRGKSQDL